MTTGTIIINLAYVALLAATFTRAIVSLRLFLIVSGIGFIVFGVLDQNWSMVLWNIVTIGLHLRQLARHFQSRRRVALSREEQEVRCRHFPDLNDFDFTTLWSMGETLERVDDVLMHRGEAHGRVALILDGIVEVDRASDPSVRLHAGALVGEMSFVAGGPATAQTQALGCVTLREWRHERLEALDVLNPAASKALHRLIQRDLVAKVAERRADEG